MPFRIAAHPLPGLGDLVAEQLDALAALNGLSPTALLAPAVSPAEPVLDAQPEWDDQLTRALLDHLAKRRAVEDTAAKN
jgi:hypothetical protein